jgi:uroporphyrinogen decarboxylase
MRRALWRQPVDHLPMQTNFTPATGAKLAAHFGCTIADLPARLDNQLVRLDLTHERRVSPDSRVAYDWWGTGWGTETEGYWHAFAPLADPTNLDAFAWPNPDDPHLLDDARRLLDADQGRHFVVPNLGFALFERAWSLRGFDQFLIDLVSEPARAEHLLERIVEIQVRLAHRFVALGVDGGYFGDDYGAQKSLLFSPKLWRQRIQPRLARLFAVFREAGLPVILHSDGDLWPILPDLVDIGLTCLNPVQPEVLNHERLFREFGRHLSFYGGVSTQDVLPYGTPDQVRAATRACAQTLAPDGTGLLLGPSHRMQSDIPLENVMALLEALVS